MNVYKAASRIRLRVSVVSVSAMLLVNASALLVYTVQKNIAQVLFLGDIFFYASAEF